jgi:hypothetical protein
MFVTLRRLASYQRTFIATCLSRNDDTGLSLESYSTATIPITTRTGLIDLINTFRSTVNHGNDRARVLGVIETLQCRINPATRINNVMFPFSRLRLRILTNILYRASTESSPQITSANCR